MVPSPSVPIRHLVSGRRPGKIECMTEPNDEPSAEEEDNLNDHRRRMRFQWPDLMEDLIEDGRRRGLFENLPGKGKPLDLEQNIYEGSQTLANQIMKANDIKPAWLSHRLGVVEKIETFRAEMARTWQRYRTNFAYAPDENHRQALNVGWNEVCQGWQVAVDKLNKEIDSYNLKRPPAQIELYKLLLADELKRIEAPRYLM